MNKVTVGCKANRCACLDDGVEGDPRLTPCFLRLLRLFFNGLSRCGALFCGKGVSQLCKSPAVMHRKQPFFELSTLNEDSYRHIIHGHMKVSCKVTLPCETRTSVPVAQA